MAALLAPLFSSTPSKTFLCTPQNFWLGFSGPSASRCGVPCAKPPSTSVELGPSSVPMKVSVVAAAAVGATPALGLARGATLAVDNPIVVIDNYDSFTYNLCQYIGELGANFEVYRNDEVTIKEIKKRNPRGIIISPGPGAPQESGISLQAVFELGESIPLFGVCMGLQCIGEAFGGKIVRSPFGVMHGKSSLVYYNEEEEDGLLSGLPNRTFAAAMEKKRGRRAHSPFTAGRYHSLVIENDSFPSDELQITAWTDNGLVMAARHRKYKHIQGVQFHPESIITTEGKMIIRNFIRLIERMETKDPSENP